MVVVSAVAFVAGALCLYYGARALRTKRAVRQLDRSDDPSDRVGWRGEKREADRRDADRSSVTDRRDDVEFERGFVLLVVALLCLLFGVLAL